MEKEDGASEIFAHLEPFAPGEVDVERREHAAGNGVAVGCLHGDVLNAAARVDEAGGTYHVFRHTNGLVRLTNVGGDLARGPHGR